MRHLHYVLKVESNVESHPVSIPSWFSFRPACHLTFSWMAVSIGSGEPLMANIIVMLKVFYMSSYHIYDSNDKANIKLKIELLM